MKKLWTGALLSVSLIAITACDRPTSPTPPPADRDLPTPPLPAKRTQPTPPPAAPQSKG